MDESGDLEWWKSVYYEKSGLIPIEIISDAIWFKLLNIARRRFHLAKKFSIRNEDPQRYDRLVYGELLGIQQLSRDLCNGGIIINTSDNAKAIISIIEQHKESCDLKYEYFP